MSGTSANKRLAKNTFLLYLRQFFVLALGLYTSRLTLQVLGETDFGIYATVGGITSLLTIITTSLSAGTQRFITFELGAGNQEKLNKVYITSINIHLILSLILVLVGETAGTWFIFEKMTVPEDRLWITFWVFQITLLNSVLNLINVPNNAEIIAHEDMGAFAVVAIIDAVFKFVAVVGLFFVIWDKLLIYAIALFLIQFFQRTVCLWYCKRKYPEVNYQFLWDKPLMKSMIHIAGWMSLSNLAVTGFIQGVNILLNLFFGPIMNAAYTVAMQAYSGIRSFCSSFQLASNPQIVKLYAGNELERMHNLLCSVCKMSFFLIFILSLPFLINSEYVLTLWLGKVPEHAQSFFILLLLYAYIDVLAYPLDIAAQATGKVKTYCIWVSVAVLLILPITYVLYTIGAVAEIVYAVAIAMSFVTLFIRLTILGRLISLSKRKFVVEVILRSIFVMVTSVSIPIIFSYLTPITTTNVICSFIICFGLSVIVTLVLGLNIKERSLLKSMLISIKNKLHG